MTNRLSVFFRALFMKHKKEGSRANQSTRNAHERRRGKTITVPDYSSTDYSGKGVRHVERNLNAGPSEHFATFGVTYDEILQGAADAEEEGRSKKRE